MTRVRVLKLTLRARLFQLLLVLLSGADQPRPKLLLRRLWLLDLVTRQKSGSRRLIA